MVNSINTHLSAMCVSYTPTPASRCNLPRTELKRRNLTNYTPTHCIRIYVGETLTHGPETSGPCPAYVTQLASSWTRKHGPPPPPSPNMHPCMENSRSMDGAGSGIRTHEGLRHGIAHPREASQTANLECSARGQSVGISACRTHPEHATRPFDLALVPPHRRL